MKANFYYLAGLVGIILSSCATDVIFDDKLETKNDSHFLKVEVTDKFAAAATRADYSGFPATTFEEDDAIGMYTFNGTTYVASNVRYVKQSDGSWLPDEDVPYCDGYTYYAYFPYRSTVYTPSTSGTVDAVDTKFADFIADGNNYFWQADQSTKAGFTYSNLMIARGTVTDVGEDEATVKFTMAHKRGLAIVSAANKWYYTDATGTKYTATPVFDGANVPFDESGTLYYLVKPNVNTSAFGRTINLPAGEYKSCPIKLTGTPTYTYYINGSSSASSKPDWLTVTANAVNDEPTEFAVSATPASASNYRTYSDGANSAEVVTLKANTAASNVDLSMVNNDGSSRVNGRTTANCYLVHAPGSYKIPLVYGNAIKNGSTNRNAYYTTQTSNTLQNFVNHNDVGIYTENDDTDPWIKNHSITVAGAKLIWQDVQGMISSVGISGDYLTFTVDPDNIAPGNAVIAATTGENGTGDIVWSWHIWVTTETLSNLTTIATGRHDYQLTSVYVGWITSTIRTYTGNTCRVQVSNNDVTLTFDVTQADGSSPISGYHPYYQWGRKDALIPSNGSGNYNHKTWDINGNVLTSSTSNTCYSLVSGKYSIGTTIKNPIRHYYNSSNYGPYKEFKYNYWDAENTTPDNNNDGSTSRAVATVKTVYDPCPPDFCVPTSNCFYYIYSNSSSYFTWSSSPAGGTWNMSEANVFFPGSGIRNSSYGALTNVGNTGTCWTATPHSTNFVRMLGFTAGGTSWSRQGGAEEKAVRAVAEE